MSATNPPPRPRVLVDCDPGHDDAVMLVCAAAFADVVAITTVNGNVGLHRTTANALAIARHLDWDVPIHAGAARPLLAEPIDAPEVHGHSGMDGVTLPDVGPVAPGDAVEVIIESTRAEEGLWLVPTGPLTNVALALRADPGLDERLAGISFMGGGATGGNVTAAAEFNVYADPEAAAITLRARCPVRMCGLDVTHQVTTDAAFAARVREVGGPAATLVAEVVEAGIARFGRYATSTVDPPMHDPVALFAVTHPHLVESTVAAIEVDTGFGPSRGATIVDRRIVTRDGVDPRVGVTTEWVHTADGPAMLDLIVEACRRWS